MVGRLSDCDDLLVSIIITASFEEKNTNVK